MRGSPSLEDVKLTIPSGEGLAKDTGPPVSLPRLRTLRLRGDAASVDKVFSLIVKPDETKIRIAVMDRKPIARFVKRLFKDGNSTGLGITASFLERGDDMLYSLSFSVYSPKSNFDRESRLVKLIMVDIQEEHVGLVVSIVASATSCRQVDISGLSWLLCGVIGGDVEDGLTIPAVESVVINLMQTTMLYNLQ